MMDPSRSPATGLPLKLARERVRKRLTQREVAKRAGLHEAMLCFYESGSRKPSLRNLERWCDALGFELDIRLKR